MTNSRLVLKAMSIRSVPLLLAHEDGPFEYQPATAERHGILFDDLNYPLDVNGGTPIELLHSGRRHSRRTNARSERSRVPSRGYPLLIRCTRRLPCRSRMASTGPRACCCLLVASVGPSAATPQTRCSISRARRLFVFSSGTVAEAGTIAEDENGCGARVFVAGPEVPL